jgi:two-component system, chemotaxis family, chemotaxis protein CheY
MNALIIDDSRAMRRILGKIMKGLGFEILEAENGAQGLETFLAKSDMIEVTLVDWNMPVMNGLEFVEAVRDKNEFDTDKLVMVTTETEPARMARALMAGVDEFVMKPFTTEILIEKLKLIGVRMPDSVTS